MKVLELQQLLSDFDPDMEVKFSYNYGDYWKTNVASDITDVDTAYVEYSSYHSMDKISEDEDDDTKCVVVIS